jgi:hypothetical protein
MLLVVEGNQEPGPPSNPAGWNAGDMGAGPSGGPHTAVYWKVAGAETSVSVTPHNGGSSVAWVIRYAQGSDTPASGTSSACSGPGAIPGVCTYGSTAASSVVASTTATNTALSTEIQIMLVPANHTLSLSNAQSFTLEGTSGVSATGDAIAVADQVMTNTGTPTAPTWSLGGTTNYAYISLAFH